MNSKEGPRRGWVVGLGFVAAAAALVAVVVAVMRPAAEDPIPDDQAGDTTAVSANASSESNEDRKLLDEGKRKDLWDIEHIAFTMEQKVLPQLTEALTKPDRELLKEYLHAEFQAGLPPTDWTAVYESESITIARQTADAKPLPIVDRESFLDRMLGYSDFLDAGSEARRKAKIGLVRLGPVQNSDLNSPWRGVWRLRMWGERDGFPAELSMDIEVDLEPLTDEVASQRGIIRTATIPQVERRSCQRKTFVDVTAGSGVNVAELYDYWLLSKDDFIGSAGGVYLADYDQDGVVDMLIDDKRAGAVLYRGLGDCRFEMANDKADLPTGLSGNEGACWADLDNDGDDDLICGHRVFSNDGDGTFTDVTRRSNLQMMGYSALSVADFDGDGLVDLYESHGHAPCARQARQRRDRSKPPSWIDGGLGNDNVLWKNLGNWRFKDVTEELNAGDEGGSCFTSIWFDANNDLRPDLLAINEFGRNALLMNQPNGPFSRTRIDPLFGGWSMGVTAGDYDNDGDNDVFIANMYSKAGNRVISNVDPNQYPKDIYQKIFEGTLGNKLYLGTGDGGFEVAPYEPVFASIGWTYGNAFVDYNGDGLLDLYATAGFKSEEKGKPDG